MKCLKHPTYKGLRTPTTIKCDACWQIWVRKLFWKQVG